MRQPKNKVTGKEVFKMQANLEKCPLRSKRARSADRFKIPFNKRSICNGTSARLSFGSDGVKLNIALKIKTLGILYRQLKLKVDEIFPLNFLSNL